MYSRCSNSAITSYFLHSISKHYGKGIRGSRQVHVLKLMLMAENEMLVKSINIKDSIHSVNISSLSHFI